MMNFGVMLIPLTKQLQRALTGLVILLSVWGLAAGGLAHAMASHPCEATHGPSSQAIAATSVQAVGAECAVDSVSIPHPEPDTAPDEHALVHCACIGCVLPSSINARIEPEHAGKPFVERDNRNYASHHPELNVPPIIAAI